MSRRLVLCAAALLFGCAGRPDYHGFDFSPRVDSPGIKVLDWRYGELKPSPWQFERMEQDGVGLQGANVNAPMQVPDHVYVKWQVPPDGRIFERTIDLAGKLPRSMEQRRVLLMFRGGEPHVYLITRNDRPCDGAACVARVPTDVPGQGRTYSFSIVKQIYPSPPD